MATLPLPGQPRTPSTAPTTPLDPDEVGYRQDAPKHVPHTPEACPNDHCSCHLPPVFQPPSMALTSREALVLAWHLFPLKDDEDLSFEDIGKKLGVTETRVRQIYMRAAAKIRAYERTHYPRNPHRDS